MERTSRSISRRRFLESAATASAALIAAEASAAPRIPSNAVIRVGLIGRDGHFPIVLNSIPHLKNIEWTAYAKGEPDENPSWIRRQRAWSSKTRVYANYHEMFDKEKLDVVCVCMPLYLNAGASIEAARHRINVLSEKPAATTLEDLSRLEKAVRESGIQYSIMLDMRGMPIFQTACKAVRQGLIGEPILLTGQKSYIFGPERPWYYKQRKTFGGSIAWVGIHALDYMRWVSGLDYRRVAAWEGNKAHPKYPGCEDHAGLLFELSNKGTGTCHLDYLRPANAPTHGDSRLRIAGSEGVLEALEFGNRVNVISSKGTNGDLKLAPEVDLFSAYIAALRGEGKPLVSAEDSFYITRVCLKARDAADRGTWVSL